MANINVIYLIISGASTARLTPHLLQRLTLLKRPIYTLLTDGARNLISPARLLEEQGHKLVDSYFDPILLDNREPGLTLVAPATFNTLNKMAHGIADTLPHSLIAEAIGGHWPVVVAPSVNPELAHHPQFARSVSTLRTWGVTVLELRVQGETLVMASVDDIVTAAQAALT